MRFMLLIEQDKLQQWCVVMRECTRTGLSKSNYSFLTEHPSKRQARTMFERLKTNAHIEHTPHPEG